MFKTKVEWEARVGENRLQFSIFSSLGRCCRWDQEVLLLRVGFKHAHAHTNTEGPEMSFLAGEIKTCIL